MCILLFCQIHYNQMVEEQSRVLGSWCTIIELKRRLMYECWCNERLKAKAEDLHASHTRKDLSVTTSFFFQIFLPRMRATFPRKVVDNAVLIMRR